MAAPMRSDCEKCRVYVVDGEAMLVRVAPPILVTAFATATRIRLGRVRSPRSNSKTVEGNGRRRLSPHRCSLLSQSNLLNCCRSAVIFGLQIKARAGVVAALSVVRPRRDIRVTSVPGWCGKSFVLPDESYRPSGPDRKKLLLARQQTVLVGEYRRKGTLDEWKRHNGRKIVHSTRARLAVAVNFAAPNLRPLGLNSFRFNFSGTTSGGKTLLLRMAASASGLNSNAGPATWDGTPAAFEQRAMGHRDGMMLLDDIGHLEGDQKCIAKLVTFRLAGNRAKERAGQYVGCAQPGGGKLAGDRAKHERGSALGDTLTKMVLAASAAKRCA